MRDYAPKPLVEEHYHIQELIEAQEKRSDERQYFRDKERNREERQKQIDNAKMVVATDFHCWRCSQDFKQNAVLNVELDWSNPTQYIAFYKGKHRKCGNWCIRLVTDKHQDGFWMRSKAVKREQGEHFADLLQPYETGFNLLYGKPDFTRNG